MPREDIDVLREIVSQDRGRGVTAGDVRAMVGWADENHHVTYRFDNLEERGLVETEKDPGRGPNNQLPPRVASATEEGMELIGAVEFEQEDAEWSERFKMVEKQMGKIRDTYAEVKQRIVEIEETLEEYDRDLDEIDSDVEALREAFERDGIAMKEDFEFADD